MEQQVVLGDIQWRPIGQTSNQLILYNPSSHALSVQPHSSDASTSTPHRPKPLLLSYDSGRNGTETPIETIARPTCPYCNQLLPVESASLLNGSRFQHLRNESAGSSSAFAEDGGVVSGGYFQILERAHEGSRPPSPRLREKSRSVTPGPEPDYEDERAETDDLPGRGYYDRFFREEGRLGIGAEGSVYLATHVIGGNILGTYAVKKIAVGSSKSYLVKMLREVRLLETLRHPNIIPYHHAWIEPTRFSSFGSSIKALHLLMMYATAGNLDSFLLTRSHSTQPSRPDLSAGNVADGDSLGQLPRAERIKAFKKRRQSGAGGRKMAENRGVMLLSLEEITALFGDIVEGLAFLHGSSILHLDLKCSNVLLHWEDGKLIPKAMLSDFGTSEEMLRGKRERTGHTGTMEYMAPETLVLDGKGSYRPSDSHADMWSLGMILHKLLFLHLPYSDTDDFEQLQAEITAYKGFMPSAELIESCKRRHIPRDLLLLLSGLAHVVPEARPAAEKVRAGMKGLKHSSGTSSLGGLVTKFKMPFAQSDTTRISREATPRQDEWPTVSPVREILALPSPSVEPPPQLLTSPSYPPLGKYAYTAYFAIKILSLQPQLTGEHSLYLIFSLLLIDIMALQSQSWLVEGVSSSLHLALLSTRWSLPFGGITAAKDVQAWDVDPSQEFIS